MNKAEYLRKWRKENPELNKATQHRWYIKHREIEKEKCREYYWKHKKEISEKGKLKRGTIIGVCPLCGYKGTMHKDHDHITNKQRGHICGSCNRALGLVKDNIRTLKNMIEYLMR